MRIFSVFVAVLLIFQIKAQPSDASVILHELYKLQNTRRVLYLAAHPDDENTRMISYLVNGEGARTAYLSLTRGDGGQNLIGSELGNKLGVVRTQELMQARRIDGGEQFFSRAIDFGYSKSSKETFQKWGKETILEDVVYVIRKFRPDVIITRFPPDARAGHGHHTASAMLAIEAFNKAADPTVFPEQLDKLKPWQAQRIYWNASVWWNPKLDSLANIDSDILKMDVGGYSALRGASYNEIASLSRTQHKSQGFGVAVARGESMEYLQYLDGDKAATGLFDNIPKDWSRYGFKTGDKQLRRIISEFDPANPAGSVESLLKLKSRSSEINDLSQREYFEATVNDIILQCLGLYAELNAGRQYYTPGEKVSVDLEIINRSNQAVYTKTIKWGTMDEPLDMVLAENKLLEKNMEMQLPKDFTQAHWLNNPSANLFDVKKELMGVAEFNPLTATIVLSVNEQELTYDLPLQYKYSDRVEGEVIKPCFVVPALSITAADANLVFVKDKSQKLSLKLKFFDKSEKHIKFVAQNWKVEPAELLLTPAFIGEEKMIDLEVSPLAGSENTHLKMLSENENQLYSITEVQYPHIEDRLVIEEAQVKLIKLNLKKRGVVVGYIPGAGDNVAEAIRQMGYEVDILSEEQLRNGNLNGYKAIVAGIRAYNTQEWLPGMKSKLMDYVKNGGNYIVQYNTASRDLITNDWGPYELEISRERVTEEDAEVIFTMPDHPVLNRPNKLDKTDFEGWVQERGLYFANRWDDNYASPIGWNDQGEALQQGGLLIGEYGKGAFIYTGISFFRELPAGVPGAYRLMANLLSYSNTSSHE